MDKKVEIITAVRPRTRNAMDYAKRAEEAGWDGIGFLDNQNLCSDTYVSLALAASATERIQLSTDVTNPVTRHPAVTASAIASIQEVSEGRATLGIGRGDSALAFVGRAPAYTRVFERYLKALQAFLNGDSVAFDDLAHSRGLAPHVETLNLTETAGDSRLRWLDSRDKKVPVSVAASGPRVIGTAARNADIVMFALGADLERLGWGLEQARSARREAGLDPDGIRYGAYLNVVCHPERLDVARESVPFLDTFVRFSVMHGQTHGPVTQMEEEVLARMPKEYRMWNRNVSIGPPAEFVDRFAIVGPPETCIRRIQEVVDLGIDRIVVMGPTVDETDDERKRCAELMAREVLPAFSGMRSKPA